MLDCLRSLDFGVYPAKACLQRSLAVMLLAVLISLVQPRHLRAAELEDAQKLLEGGKYAECIAECAKAIVGNGWQEGWRLAKIRAELATGQYDSALATYEAAASRYTSSIQLRLLGIEVLQANDRPEEAVQLLSTIRELAARDTWRYGDSANRVAIGRALLASGADARQVLELFYDSAKRSNPSAPEPHLASGDLALAKNDYALAAESYREAAKRSPENPDVYYGLARSYTNDREQAAKALAKALELNPNHTDSLLFQVDNTIDAEQYELAESLLKQVLEINARHPRAWAYRAVLAHLAGKREDERAHRREALSTWRTNPEVDHLIGKKLSENYRFAEGATYQRQALCFDPAYRPAKVQLCQDLLRRGQEEEGWQLAAEVFDEDKYNVLAYNLSTLHENLAKFRTLENEDFIVRMDEREADIYGSRVMELLARAKQRLCTKYDVSLADPIIVELFPQQKDFAIRTFGMPGGAGFLGVCFGGVITANSPASQGSSPSNWEAVLWHEFCHVVTLHKTRNKMPRWLSEGISVYEERQQNAAWGQSMTPKYREMVLDGEATPVSQLSGAFLKPESPLHLQFAYYQSSMVVEYLVGRYGVAALQRVLDDLGESVPINQALARHTEPIEKLDEDFAAWFKRQAEELAPGVDWEKPEFDAGGDADAIAAWNRAHPDNFWGLLAEAQALVGQRQWEAAKRSLARLIELYPNAQATDGPYGLLAIVHRELGETPAERAVLEKLVALDSDAVDARLRLADLAAEQEDWRKVAEHAKEALAIHPLMVAPHRHLAKAAEALHDRPGAIAANQAMLRMESLDLAELHFRLAGLLKDDGKVQEARLHALKSLEQAPRYRAAHRLLLEIVRQSGESSDNAVKEPPSSDSNPTPSEQDGKDKE